jgi:hypothetical protein
MTALRLHDLFFPPADYANEENLSENAATSSIRGLVGNGIDATNPMQLVSAGALHADRNTRSYNFSTEPSPAALAERERLEYLLNNALKYAHLTNPKVLTIYKSEAIQMYQKTMSKGRIEYPDIRNDNLFSVKSRAFLYDCYQLALSYITLTIDSVEFDVAVDSVRCSAVTWQSCGGRCWSK